MNSQIENKIKAYIDLNKQLSEKRKKMTEDRKLLLQLETEIEEYMDQHSKNSVTLDDCEIVRYDKKVSQTFKKEAMVENINTIVKDTGKSEKLVDTILENKSFKIEKKIKLKIKK